MRKIIELKVIDFRKIFLKFDDGTKGVFTVEDEFSNVAEPLNDYQVFATAKIIDDGFGIGFENCEYDICAQHAYNEIKEHEYAQVI